MLRRLLVIVEWAGCCWGRKRTRRVVVEEAISGVPSVGRRRCQNERQDRSQAKAKDPTITGSSRPVTIRALFAAGGGAAIAVAVFPRPRDRQRRALAVAVKDVGGHFKASNRDVPPGRGQHRCAVRVHQHAVYRPHKNRRRP